MIKEDFNSIFEVYHDTNEVLVFRGERGMAMSGFDIKNNGLSTHWSMHNQEPAIAEGALVNLKSGGIYEQINRWDERVTMRKGVVLNQTKL